MDRPGEASPSVARALSDLETADVIATARALPTGWVVTIEPPYGQLAIHPRIGAHRYRRCWVGSPDTRSLFHDGPAA